MRNLFLAALTAVLIFSAVVMCAFAGQVDTTKAVIHHTASGDVSAATIDQWHKARGWDCIGYHYVIRADGTVEAGRPLSKRGAHAANPRPSRNRWVGIALTGNDTFTYRQLKSLMKLLKQLGVRHVERHHEECPGVGLNVEKIQQKLNIYWKKKDARLNTSKDLTWKDLEE